MASLDLRGQGHAATATTSPHFSSAPGLTKVLGLSFLIGSVAAAIPLALFGMLSLPHLIILGGSFVIGLVMLALERIGYENAAAALAIYGLSACLIAARLSVYASNDLWRMSILVTPLIALAAIVSSGQNIWRIGALQIGALWLDVTWRSTGAALPNTLLVDAIMLTLAYTSCCIVGHLGRRAFDDMFVQIDANKRTIASRNTLLERQVRERETVERRQAEIAKDMRAVMSAAQELITCETVSDVWRRAVEIAQSRLGVERSSILLIDADGKQARGAFGVDMRGVVCEIATQRLDIASQRWASLFYANNPDNPAWLLDSPDVPDAEGLTGHRSWVAVTAIRARAGNWLGVFYNDTALSGRPFSATKQDVIAVYMSLVAGIVHQKQLEQESRTHVSTNATLAERSRLARELHDSVSQALFGIVLGSRTAVQLNADEDTSKALDYVLTLAESALVDIRALIFELRPESLALEGLVPSLQKQIETIMQRHHIALTFDAPAEPPLSIEAREAVYRVLIEAAHNIAKHANATAVHVVCVYQPKLGIVRAEIHDNGSGFDPQRAFDGHYGLVNMRERMLRLNGTCTFESAPGKGTHVIITLPASVLSESAVA
jgi:signal transduction histidine kinase